MSYFFVGLVACAFGFFVAGLFASRRLRQHEVASATRLAAAEENEQDTWRAQLRERALADKSSDDAMRRLRELEAERDDGARKLAIAEQELARFKDPIRVFPTRIKYLLERDKATGTVVGTVHLASEHVTVRLEVDMTSCYQTSNALLQLAARIGKHEGRFSEPEQVT